MFSVALNWCATVALSLSVGADVPAPDKAYPIKLERPVKVGTRYRVSAVGNEQSNQTIKANGQVVQQQKESRRVELIGVTEVLKVDEKGRELKKSITIEKFVVTKDGQAGEPLCKGAVVIAETQGENTAFSLKDGELDSEAQAALNLVLDTHTSSDLDDDEVMGSKTPRRVGETWPVNTKPIVKMLNKVVTVAPEDLAGKVKLVGVVHVNGVPCLNIASSVTCTRFKIPGAPGLTLQKGSAISMSMDATYPVDTSIGGLGGKMKMAFKVLGSMEPQPGVKAVIEQTRLMAIEKHRTFLQ